MDRRDQGRRNQNSGLDGFALPEDPSSTVSLGRLLGDFERYIRTNPHQAEQLLGTLTGIAFQNGCLSPAFFPPPMVDEFGRIGAPPGDAPMAPYKKTVVVRVNQNPESQGPVIEQHLPKSDLPAKPQAEPRRAPSREELIRGFIKAFDSLDKKPE